MTVLADAARRPHRARWLLAVSRRAPVPLLLGLRLAARRPRRLVLTVASVAITVATIVAVLGVHTHFGQLNGGYSTLNNPLAHRVDRVLLIVTVVLAILAALNATFITWATAMDTRHPAAVARAIGASAEQVSTGLSAAMLMPALAGAILGIPAGVALLAAAGRGASLGIPSVWTLVAIAVSAAAGLAGLALVPARAAARRPPAEILRSEAP